jgi:hypothetical protein
MSAKTCSFIGCEKKVHSRELCGGHYRQQKVGEELRPLQQQFHGLSEEDRFMKWVAKQPNGCWHWLGSIMKKKDKTQLEWHGQWRNSAGQIELVHRAAWRMFKGDFPKKAFVLHHCDNPKCVNIDHLYLGTQQQNMVDMWARKRSRPGVSLGEKHGMSKLTEELVREIRSSSETGVEIARRLDISTTNVYDVRNRKIWKHVD